VDRRHVLGWIAAAPALTHAQSTTKKPPSPPPPPMSAASAAAIADLAGDVTLMAEALATLHPGLLRYNAQIQIDTTMTSIKRSFAGAPDLAQRFLVLSRFLAMLKCGHSYANFFNQKKEVQQALFDKRSRLPFAMRWIGEGMFVTSEQDKLQRGTQVGAINGVPVRTMLQALLPYTRADGNNDAKRRNLLNLRGLNKYEFFDVFHGLVYGEPPGGVFRLDVKTPDGKISVVEVPALTTEQRHAQLPTVTDDAPLWDWRMTDQGVAVLAMPSWALYNSKWDWQAWLNEKLEAFASDDAAKGLVVDLRGNEGGLDCGDVILERFLKADSALPLRRLVRYQKTPTHLNKVLDTWDESFRDWGDKAKRFDDRFFALPAGDTTIKPKGARIDKPLVVLTDAANSSAAFTFA
jgi:hypothetical protein